MSLISRINLRMVFSVSLVIVFPNYLLEYLSRVDVSRELDTRGALYVRCHRLYYSMS